MRAFVFDTEAECARALAVIESVRGPTETETVLVGGVVVSQREVPAKSYDVPQQLADGRWCIRHHRSFAAISGKRGNDGTRARMAPREADAVELEPVPDPLTGEPMRARDGRPIMRERVSR